MRAFSRIIPRPRATGAIDPLAATSLIMPRATRSITKSAAASAPLWPHRRPPPFRKTGAEEPAAPWLGESDAPDHARLARTEYSHSGPRLGIAFAPGGLRIAVVDENSPAWRAGLSPNDVVKKAGGKNVTTAADFAKALEDGATTGGLRLTVERDSAEYTAAIPLNAQSR